MRTARAAALGGRARPEARWGCYTEDAMVGLAVHRAVRAAQLGVLFVALNERIVDVQVRGRVRLLRLGCEG